MRKFVAATCLAAGLTAIPALASAAPIGTNACTLVNDVGVCDIFADYEGSGASSLEGIGGYLPGYTILLNGAADLSDGFQASDVAHILVIHDTLFELFSNTVFDTLFNGAFAAALAVSPIDGQSPSIGQLAGCPAVPTGVPNLGRVGYCTTADIVSLGVNWGDDASGGFDLLNIHTALPVEDDTPVPEPGTLSLLALGASGALAARRRRRTPNQPAL